MSGNHNHVPPRKVVVVNQDLSLTSASGVGSFNVDLIAKGVSFVPQKMIVRQLIYSNIAGTDLGTYLIWSNLANDFIGCVYVGIQGDSTAPLTEIPLYLNNSVQGCRFTITPANAAFHAVTGQLTMTLEFIGY